ncbi:hypothetical protein FRC08_005084 [Ceratobasidium sp. 394]|nr:hypothetical protein FRC08_005084 [Ceratobasidium sp. 394]KAG9098666.1 hypothetical protein FS749_003290 [Ceratobasidium sp. UAMH 11750]
MTAPALELGTDCLPGCSSNTIDQDPTESNNEPPPSLSVDPPLCNVPGALAPSSSTAGTRSIAPLPSCKLYKQTQLGFARIPRREEWLLQERHHSPKDNEIKAILQEKEAAAKLKEALDKKEKPELSAKLAIWKPSTAVNEGEEEAFEPTDEAEEISAADLNHLTMHAATAFNLAERLTEHGTGQDIDELDFQESSDDEFEPPATSSKSAKASNNQHEVRPPRRSAREPKPRRWLQWDPSDFN